MVMYASILAVFAPLFGFLSVGLRSRSISDRLSQWITCICMGISLVSCLFLFKVIALKGGTALTIPLFNWIQVDTFSAGWSLKIDTLSVTMMAIVNIVSFLVHIYSIGYMSHDPSIPRFMAYLSFFTFSMLMLVTASNLVQLFFGWEGVGLASYLLIGFWYEKKSANDAAMKAFIVNRIGDVGLALGIAAIYYFFQTVEFDELFAQLPELSKSTKPFIMIFGYEVDAINLICILLFFGAMGKSAQLGLHTWLPDAMEGPTPVSALIHAATMVTAGVFLLVRLSPLYELAPFAQQIVIYVGALTALFAASVALTQNDIKRVIAYSTCSQLGYMFFAVGCSAYGAAMFHLVTHAFFKALLFLGAGAVIHAMSDEQNMQKMGGIYRLIPVTYAIMWIGNLALAGIPFFSGYYSKDAILESAWVSGTGSGVFAFCIGLVVAGLTAFYSWRLLFLTFHGEPHADDRVMAHVHEAPPSMKIPLFALAIGAIFSGIWGYDLFLGVHSNFWHQTIVIHPDKLEATHHLSLLIQLSPLLFALAGIGCAYLFYLARPNLPFLWAEHAKKLYTFLYHKWYFDELYDILFVRPSLFIGRLFWKKMDGTIIDGFGPDGVTSVSLVSARLVSRLQTGYVYHYAFAMLIGVVLIATWYLLPKEWLVQ